MSREASCFLMFFLRSCIDVFNSVQERQIGGLSSLSLLVWDKAPFDCTEPPPNLAFSIYKGRMFYIERGVSLRFNGWDSNNFSIGQGTLLHFIIIKLDLQHSAI